MKSFQDYYADDYSYCYGCGRLNEKGLQIKSFWDGDESVCVYHPKPHHIAVPGFVYGGLIASVMDCHGTGTAAAAVYRDAGIPMDQEMDPPIRFLTASLHVDFLKPTPLGMPIEVRGRVVDIKGRKVVVSEELFSNGEKCAKGNVVAVKMPEDLINRLLKNQ
jgi:acyl-coenzyme A thioesterase PaaI-like protein